MFTQKRRAALLIFSFLTFCYVCAAQVGPVPTFRRLTPSWKSQSRSNDHTTSAPLSKSLPSGAFTLSKPADKQECLWLPGTPSCDTSFAQAYIEISGELKKGDQVQLKIADSTYNYTVVEKDTLQSVVSALVAAVSLSNSGRGDANVTAEDRGLDSIGPAGILGLIAKSSSQNSLPGGISITKVNAGSTLQAVQHAMSAGGTFLLAKPLITKRCVLLPVGTECITNKAQAYVRITGGFMTGDKIQVKIEDSTYNYTVVNNDTLETIAGQLVNAVNSSHSGSGDPYVIAHDEGAGIGNDARLIGLVALSDDDSGAAVSVSVTNVAGSTLVAVQEVSQPPKAVQDQIYLNGINDFYASAGTVSYFDQIKSVFNSSSNSMTISADVATLNLPHGFQAVAATNVQAGANGTSAAPANGIPTLSVTGAAQAAQNMLYGGTFVARISYPLIAWGLPKVSSPGGISGLITAVGHGGVDIQNFKASTNESLTSPPWHAGLHLEGYTVVNSTHLTSDSGNFTGSLFAGFSAGGDYTSPAYSVDYGFGKHHIWSGIAQISFGMLINNVAKVGVSYAFGPSQVFYNSAGSSTVPVTRNNFSVWTFMLTYQKGASK